MNTQNDQWIVQITLPWMNDTTLPKGKSKPTPAPRWRKKCARSLALRYMRECGPIAKARIFNPITKRYEAYVPMSEETPGKEGVKVYHGRDADHDPDA